MQGWIINEQSDATRTAHRPGQQPNFYIDMDGRQEPVFEVWIWDDVAKVWYVMTTDESRIEGQGVAFHPAHTEEQLTSLRDQWRAYRLAGGQWPIR